MHALRNIHTALVPDGLLVDTQPVGPQPRVTANGHELGTLDMREWIETIQAVDERVDETMASGLFEQTEEQTLVIRSTFDDGPDCFEITGTWQGTRVPKPLADRLAAMRDQVIVDQQVRLRVLSAALDREGLGTRRSSLRSGAASVGRRPGVGRRRP